MFNEDGSISIVFNGEIYNHQELRTELLGAGHRFRSTSDTEVLVHGYEQWGVERLLGKLRGMFAFALHDAKSQSNLPTHGTTGTLILARDRFGIKPLYYARSANAARCLLFGSEVRALRASNLVDTADEPLAWLGFLLFGSVPAPLTTIRGIRALPAGSFIVASDELFHLASYYSADQLHLHRSNEGQSVRSARKHSSDQTQKPEALRAKLRPILEEAVALHLLSDAPLGVFLSGGIDSSALVALAAQRRQSLCTIGIVFDEAQYSEERFQRLVAERYKTDHHSIRISAVDFHEHVAEFLSCMDQPTVDGLNTYFVSLAARRAGVKAVLTGIGGDELFAGYSTLRRAPLLSQLQALPALVRHAALGTRHVIAKHRKLAYLEGRGPLPLYLAQRGLYAPAEAARILKMTEREVWNFVDSLAPVDSPDEPAAIQQFLEMRHYLMDQLLRDADIFGMAHSLEIRVPFLDHVLAETALEAPMDTRLDDYWPKPLLSQTLEDLLPHDVIFRRKQGFTFPIGSWLRASDSVYRDLTLCNSAQYSQTVWDQFQRGRVHWSRPWSLLVLANTVLKRT